ncbi:hypothetical protein JL101_034695 (plasmid) [Skermanella rosea]|uniref:DUF883 family protein n=1 Tax=Skermanella rosea TaxID=1817965 RepID=UPI0019349EAA|nr:hypothetical protein [Skermanella rosea]UEM07726.1 hypothetical protein JL101_034695 [Skermanella rosea]
MTGSAGTPPTSAKPATSQPDKAAAATTETARPSAEKILETGPEEVGAPTPAARSPVSPATGTGTGMGSGSGGMGGVVEPSLPPRSAGSDRDAGIRSGSVASQYQRRSEQANEITERARMSAMRAGSYAREQGRRGLGTAESFVRENPATSLIAALAAGLVLGALLGRGSQGSSQRTRGYDYDYDDEEAYTRDYYYD